MPDYLMTATQAMQRLGMKRPRFLALVQAGKIRGIRIGASRRLYFKTSTIQAYER
jgi:excisionase family DNA binding protein